MRFLTADYLYPLHRAPLKEGVLKVSKNGLIIDILEDRKLIDPNRLEVFSGILCPGFINAHCHLELSHLKGIAQKGAGLLEFISVIQQRGHYSKEKILCAIEQAEEEMIRNGIVGVGDICNNIDTLSQKKYHKLQYYNFIETFQIHDDKVRDSILLAQSIKRKFRKEGHRATIVPHAPYSVSPILMQEIINSFDSSDDIISIHMQETKSEAELFQTKRGNLFAWLKTINASSSIWEKRSKSADIFKGLEAIRFLLVHNTYTKKAEPGRHYYCTCPKANLYIENTLPDYSIFDTDKLCVGTDSLASNNSLSILEELLILKENSDFDLNTLLKIGSKNGAEALGFRQLGTFENGKKPGVNLISSLEELDLKVIL